MAGSNEAENGYERAASLRKQLKRADRAIAGGIITFGLGAAEVAVTSWDTVISETEAAIGGTAVTAGVLFLLGGQIRRSRIISRRGDDLQLVREHFPGEAKTYGSAWREESETSCIKHCPYVKGKIMAAGELDHGIKDTTPKTIDDLVALNANSNSAEAANEIGDAVRMMEGCHGAIKTSRIISNYFCPAALNLQIERMQQKFPE